MAPSEAAGPRAASDVAVRRPRQNPAAGAPPTPVSERRVFPFAAIVGQEAMTTALMAAAVDPGLGGILVFGDRGTGKSTAVRALAQLLPARRVVEGCPYGCEAGASSPVCPHCAGLDAKARGRGALKPIPVVDLPLGATEDRVVGALDLERALAHGEKAFEPGLLARANGGFLYIDEVNLLEDHIVDLLLDVAASGENVVERDGLSIRHPARFVLIGSGNPEEGELRPQLLDRFGLAVDVRTPTDLATRIEIVKRREAFEADRAGFLAAWERDGRRLGRKIARARARLRAVIVPDPALELAARLCMALGTDGLRGEIVLTRAARALAALEGDAYVAARHLKAMAVPALRHRLRRNPLDEADQSVRVERAAADILGA
jgi:magnesium chelatase subunit I